MTGQELKQLREDLGDAIGRPLSAADMEKLCGLAPDTGANMIRRWEVTGPSKQSSEQLRILAMASDRHPILENFNVFDRFDIAESADAAPARPLLPGGAITAEIAGTCEIKASFSFH